MSGAAASGGGLRRLSIVALLVGAVMLLHHFAAVRDRAAPATMLAFGFVVLASYAVGQLAEVVKLPHITGYLVAGLLLGASFASLLPESLHVPPFDRGVLNGDVIGGLSVLDTLAVALIAMTAGGELKIEALRAGLRTILSLLAAQGVLLFPLVMGFVFLISGVVPFLALPGLPPLATGAALALAGSVAAIAYATSPAATIAIINESGSEGPMTQGVLSSVVLKDIVVVVVFSVASAYAAEELGLAAIEGGIPRFLLVHVAGSLVIGAALGFGVSLYLRFVNREVLLFLVAVVYTATLLARTLDVDPVLLFIATGFAASNFSREADTLLENVERLSLPVYVVFFTLAGARLHLDHVAHVAPYAIGLFTVRLIAFRVGTSVGVRLSGGHESLRRHGWMGYISQAGVALSLCAIVGARFGEAGRVLETLIISVIALNELVGPVLLKFGLVRAGETAAQRAATATASAAEPAAEPAPDAEVATEWRARESGVDPWGVRRSSETRALETVVLDVERELRAIVKRIDDETLAPLADEADEYLGELRREFLRFHRRVAVQVRTEEREALDRAVHAQQAEVASRWRTAVLGRAARLRARELELDNLASALDRVVDQAPELVVARVEAPAYERKSGDSPWLTVVRGWLRVRRRVARWVGGAEPEREVPVRALVLHNLGGGALARIEGVAALIVQADLHLAVRTRSLFDAVVRSYEAIAEASRAPDRDLGEALRALYDDIEEELSLARDEVARIHVDQRHRLAVVLGQALRGLESDLAIMGTPDLPPRQRRAGRGFAQRVASLELLGPSLTRIGRMVSARFGSLALELELVALEARIRDALHGNVRELARDVRGRSYVHADRVHDALGAAIDALEVDVANPALTGETLGSALRAHTETLESRCADGARAAQQLREQLNDEQATRPLLDALRRATRELTDHYTVPAGRIDVGEWRLPAPVEVVDVAFREIVSTHIETHVAPRLITETRDAAARVTPLLTALQDLERLVAFNNELARGELEVVHDTTVPPRTRELLSGMFVGALSRTREVIAGHREQAESWDERLSSALAKSVLGAIDELRSSLVDGELSRLKLRALRQVGAGRRLMQRAERLPTWVEGVTERARHSVRGALGDDVLDRWRTTLGLPRVRTGGLRTGALEPPRSKDKLPLFYARLFAADTLEAADVLTGREASIEAARRALTGEHGGRLRAVALVGLDGVGKGTLSAAIVRSRSWKNVRRYTLSGPATAAEVEAMFRDRTEGHLVVVLGFHWLVSMRPGGFSLVRRFVEGVMADAGRNAFLVHADRLVWDYASGVAPLRDAFPEVISLDALTAEELEAAVLARHALSGYRLDLAQVSARLGLASLFVRPEARARRPHAAYFRALHAASGGLVRDALRLWLASIDRVDETTGTVHVATLPGSPMPALRTLPGDVVVELYQVARQGWMDAEAQASLFRVDRVTAEARLSRLAQLGLLERDRTAYRIAPHLRGSVYRLLEEHGWL